MERSEPGELNTSLPANEAGGGAPSGMDVLAQVAHDFRTPLTSILFLTDALRSGVSGDLSAEQREQLALIYGAALQLSTLANDITDIARRGDMVEAQAVRFSLDHVVRSVHDLVRPAAHAKPLELTFAVEASPGRLGHPVAIGRVLLNLVTNALKYTPRGSVRVRIHEVGEDVVRFSVSDTGTGLPRHVCEALNEATGEIDVVGGAASSGLGLMICRRLVATMGGQLHVTTSTEGTEISFDLSLPRA